MQTEPHPFEPFLPANAKVLMLGSFPPQEKRWSIKFYYPNFINDMWRIIGLVFFRDKDRFVDAGARKFKLDDIRDFCTSAGIAMYDTACEVRRLKDNASDKFLEVVTPTDVPALLRRIPSCKAIVTTGEKATMTLCESFGAVPPAVGDYSQANILCRNNNITTAIARPAMRPMKEPFPFTRLLNIPRRKAATTGGAM